MLPRECLRILGLGEAVSSGELKRVYRALAQRYHPDKHGGDEAARRRFSDIATAYRTLMRVARLVDSGRKVGVCWECREFGEVVTGMDGHARCPVCTLRGPRRLLPAPVVVVVKCLAAALLVGVAGYLLILAYLTGKFGYAAAALVAGATSLVALAATCFGVVYCFDDKQELANRRHARPDR